MVARLTPVVKTTKSSESVALVGVSIKVNAWLATKPTTNELCFLADSIEAEVYAPVAKPPLPVISASSNKPLSRGRYSKASDVAV